MLHVNLVIGLVLTRELRLHLRLWLLPQGLVL
jgi:hypothetical protein